MAQDVSTENVLLEVERGAEDVHSAPRDTLKRKDENDSKAKSIFADKLLHALEKNDASEVRKLLEKNHHTVREAYVNFRNECNEVKEKAEKKEESGFHRDCICSCCSNSSKESNDKQQSPEPQESEKGSINNETNLNWIKILSNPMFIGLEWLWRTKYKCECTSCGDDKKLDENEKKKKEDVIDSSLLDAYLLDEMSSSKHYDSRDVYKKSAEAYETFAADVLEKASQSELYQIMDVKGEGCLLEETPPKHRNYIQSLSFLKSAVNKRRKKFVSSSRCQAILDDVIFYERRDWQDKSTAWKFLLCLFHIVVVPVVALFYVFSRPIQKIWCSTRCNGCWCSTCCNKLCASSTCCNKLCASSTCCNEPWASVEKLFEHPYHKFMNHTIWYIAFLSLLFASSFGYEDEYRTSKTGVSRVDWAVLIFLVGLLLQEIWEVFKQGFWIYFSKWWNVVDAITIFTFVAAYMIWIPTWLFVYKEWKPRKKEFIVADVLYASATVLAFFHLAHAFQVSSTLGPLQLSLYRMLKDVAKFLFIFLLLFIAFGTGIVKVYSYYVVSQVKLREVNESQFQEYHPYAQHETTFIGLFWFLVGLVEEDKIHVDDHTFYLIQFFGRLGFIIYLICSTIVALNMLIAMMNNSFDRVMSDEDKEWKFSRTQMWLEYIGKGNAIPAPLNIIYYVVYFLILVTYGIKIFVCWIATVCCGCKCKKEQEDRRGTTEIQRRPKRSGEEIDVEKGVPDQTNEEQVNKDQTNEEQVNKDQTNEEQVNKDQTNEEQVNKDQTNEEQVSKDQTNEEQVNKDQINEEQVNKDQSSGRSCSCIRSWCCCRCGSEQSGPTGHTFTYFFSCICHGCSCFCKPIEANDVREERLQAIRLSVSKYLKNRYPDGDTELKTSALASSPEPKAGECIRE